MKTTDTINEALQRLSRFDFYWRMEDNNYMQNYQRAYNAMKAFVSLVSKIENKDVRNALRNLWILNRERALACIRGEEMNDFSSRESELMDIIAC